MLNKKILEEIGLSGGESEIYLTLLQKGESTIYEIADSSRISRPNIYDIVKKLKERGLVTSIIKKRKKYVKVTNPENLHNILKNREENLLEILPTLNKLYESRTSTPIVEIFQGSEGLKTIMNEMLNAQEILIFNGVDMSSILKQIPDFHLNKYFNEKKKRKIITKVLYSNNVKPIKNSGYQYKKLSSNTLGCANYWTYDDRVAIGIWSNELMIIRIIDENVAKTYKESINLIWNAIP